MAFLDHVTKEGGEAELQAQYKQRCGAATGRSMADALAAAEKLMTEELFTRVNAGAQNGVKAASGLLKAMLNGQSPALSSSSSSFLKWVHSDLVQFVTESQPGEASGSAGGELRGVEAVKSKFQKIMQAA